MTAERNSLIVRAVPGLIIGAVSLCVVLPFIGLSIPAGHDFEFHMNSWIEVVDQWKQGVFYPHWAAMAHYGYGEARFIFYPPFSWMLGAALGEVLPGADLNVLRGIEGARVKTLYRGLAKQFGLNWAGRRYDRSGHPRRMDEGVKQADGDEQSHYGEEFYGT